MSHHHHSHHGHHHHFHSSSHSSGTGKTVYDYNPKTNRIQKNMGIVVTVIATVLIVLSILFFTVLDNQLLSPSFLTFGILFLIMGIAQIVTAYVGKRTAAKFVKCLECGNINKNGRELCEKCGKPIRTFCTHCGSALNGGSKSCNICGQTLHFED